MKKGLGIIFLVFVIALFVDTTVFAKGVNLSAEKGWSYAEDTNTLTLSNYTGETTEDVEGKSVQIYSEGDLNIVLEGTNTLSAASEYGIYCEGNLSISGKGSLTIVAEDIGVYAAKSVKVEDADIEMSGGDSVDLIANWGDFIVSDADVTLTGSIYAKNTHDITVTGGKIVAGELLSGTNVSVTDAEVTAGIDCTGEISLEDVQLTANPAGERKDICGGRLKMTGGRIVQPERIRVSSFEIEGAEIISDTSSAILQTVPSEYESPYNVASHLMNSNIEAENAKIGFGNYYDTAAYIENSTVTIDCFNLEFETVWYEVGLYIEQGSVVHVNWFDHGWSNCLIMNGGELYVHSSMNFADDIYEEILEVNSGKLVVDGDVTFIDIQINGGTVEVAGTMNADTVTVEGGTTTVGAGINTPSFTFTEGSLEATAAEQAIVADTINITGNIQAGKNKEIAKAVSEYSGEKYVSIHRVINYTVNFVTGTKQTIKSQTLISKTKIAEPAKPDRTGYTFKGWFTSETTQTGSTKWDFSEDIITSDMTLYAGWRETTRIYGKNRYETSLNVANAYKEESGVEKFDSVVITSGKNFPDALGGSYLAGVKKAPILMASEKTKDELRDYIWDNVEYGGTIYVLGGEEAVPDSVLDRMSGYKIKRLSGATRYETNLQILEEAGVEDQDILVCTGRAFADSLSASATGMPILLLNNKAITEQQREFLEKNRGARYYIIGGESALSTAMEVEIQKYGTVERIAGENRYETSVKVAEKFFETLDVVVLAYAKNFPDGLCGGPLAMSMNAPLILTATDKETQVALYTSEKGVENGIVLGGDGLISDRTVKNIFQPSKDR